MTYLWIILIKIYVLLDIGIFKQNVNENQHILMKRSYRVSQNYRDFYHINVTIKTWNKYKL